MYRPKKYVRLEPLARTPRLADIRNLLEEGRKSRSCTIEMPWKSEKLKMPFSLTVRVELGSSSEPIWTLYEGEGSKSRVMWSTGFGDVELLYDVLTLSLPSDGPNIFDPSNRPSSFSTSGSTSSSRTGQLFNQSEENVAESESFSATSSSSSMPAMQNITSNERPSSFYESGVHAANALDQANSAQAAIPVVPVAPVSSTMPAHLAGEEFFTGDIGFEKSEHSSKSQTSEFMIEPTKVSIDVGPAHAEPAQPSPHAAYSASQEMANPNYPVYNATQPGQLPPGYPAQVPPQVPQNMPGQPGYGYPPGYNYPPMPGQPGQVEMPGQLYPPGQYPLPPGYPYPPANYPPGYAYPPNYPYPASTVPLNYGGGPTTPDPYATNLVMPNPELMNKRPMVMLGTFLVEAGLVPKTTIDAALQVQTLVSQGTLSAMKAAEAVRRAHQRGGFVEPENIQSTVPPNESVVRVKPQLGQVLVMAGIISAAQLKAGLRMQDAMRSGTMTMEQAVTAIQAELSTTASSESHFKPAAARTDAAAKGGAKASSSSSSSDLKPEPAAKVDMPDSEETIKGLLLLKQAGLLTDTDLEAAGKVRTSRGGALTKILLAAGKVDQLTIDAATAGQQFIDSGNLRVDQAMQTLYYCQRMRVPFEEAASELGFEIK